ncbi:spermidine synthase [Longispora urticae]
MHPLTMPVDLGEAEFVPDPRRRAGWTLLVDGVAQSYVDLDDPGHLEFEYMRRVAAVVAVAGPAGAPLRVLHLGGGGLTLPRYVAATRPGSTQRVVERDGTLLAAVRRILPLAAEVEFRVADAREVVESSADGWYDLVVADVYRGAQMPASVASVEFAHQVARVLRPGGLYAVNVTDLPPLLFSRRQAATLRAAFADVCVVGEPGMLRGRRFGNVVFAAATAPGAVPVARLTARVVRDKPPGRVVHGDQLDRFVSGAQPWHEQN